MIVTKSELEIIRREIQKALGFNDPMFHELTCPNCGILSKVQKADLPTLRPHVPVDVGEIMVKRADGQPGIKETIERFYEDPYKPGAVDALWRALGVRRQ